MSKLYFSETGNVISTLCEELTVFRRARKVLHLPGTANPARLYLLARPYAGSDLPLRVSVNSREIEPIRPGSGALYCWHEMILVPELLKAGENCIEFWTDATAMNAWSLALEAGHPNPGSFLSTDGGATWRNEKMGYLNILLGEYVVRLRLEEGQDPPPPAMIWENPAHPRLESLRTLLPSRALQSGPLLERVRALTGWLSSSWGHISSGVAAQYAPWDAETILAWGKVRLGHDQRLPIVMCVHYGAAFVSACAAAGIAARCLVGTESLNGPNGHFLAEVWFDELQKWVVVDPNLDAIYFKDGCPLSLAELRSAGNAAGRLVEWGSGTAYQRQYPHIEAFLQSNAVQSALWATHRSLWPRIDLLSHPEHSPVGHGVTAYCETGLVWEQKDLDEGFGCFPYFGDSDYFNSPPVGF